ncbi:hypothetical protein BJ508DRAFT_313420 [Ascobolus immersus RN42]|uniref:Uncharacterized protein n=1 Tax=Ascobolus immersus RN42 TaxID=1160509 RepID=A0A3N4HP67_ASCIM|nr:hypothetical protein BJ508DRAFT_313420 [Ascobolus immersus RN42]
MSTNGTYANNGNNIPTGFKPKQLGNLHHQHVARDEEIMEADRRNFTKFVAQGCSRRYGREKGPSFRSIYTPTAGKVPAVVGGFVMPRSAADIEALNEEELAFSLRAAGLCSHYPANGTPFSRYQMVVMLCFVAGVDPSDGFLENAPANPPASTLPKITKKEAVSANFPMHI